MTEWTFEHSITTKANKEIAWDFLSDMTNQMRMEPGVECIELDGPFVTGTTGRTITKNHTQEWKLSEVVEGKRFTITGHTPSEDLKLSFSWEFDSSENGTRLTQSIKGTGPQLDKYQEIFKGMEESTPQQMNKLVQELDSLSN